MTTPSKPGASPCGTTIVGNKEAIDRMKPRRLASALSTTMLAAASAGLLAGCVVGRNYEAPALDVPAAYLEVTDAPEPANVDLAEWWHGLDDPALDALVERALEANDDIHIALANLREARALAGAARAEWLPDAAVSTGHTARRQSLTGSEATAAGVGDTIPKDDYDRTSDFFDATFDASWEADIFGRVRRKVEAATADIEAGIEDLRDVRVSLLAEIATNYVRLREQQVRIDLNERLLESQRRTLALTRTMFEQGLESRLDVDRGEALVATTESILPTLRADETSYAAALSVLTAQSLADVRATVGRADTLPALPLDATHAGAPADLLRRRPELRRAEQELRAAVARIGVATADLYPRFTLSGSVGWTTTEFGDLDAADSLTGSFGPRISWAFLNIPEVRHRIEASDARAEAALARYQKALREAVAEVERSYASWREEQERMDALARAVASYRSAKELSRQLQENGVASYLDVLDVERQLLAAENLLASSKAKRTVDAIAVYKALGGGWEPQPEPHPESQPESQPEPEAIAPDDQAK